MRGRPAPLSVVMMRADGLHVAQIGRRHRKDRRWARKVLEQHELYCFGRLACTVDVTQQQGNSGSFIEVNLDDSTTVVSPEYNNVTTLVTALRMLADKLAMGAKVETQGGEQSTPPA